MNFGYFQEKIKGVLKGSECPGQPAILDTVKITKDPESRLLRTRIRSSSKYQQNLTLRILLQGGASGRTVGWVDYELGSSPSWWAATVATYCQSRMVEHPKSK